MDQRQYPKSDDSTTPNLPDLLAMQAELVGLQCAIPLIRTVNWCRQHRGQLDRLRRDLELLESHQWN